MKGWSSFCSTIQSTICRFIPNSLEIFWSLLRAFTIFILLGPVSFSFSSGHSFAFLDLTLAVVFTILELVSVSLRPFSDVYVVSDLSRDVDFAWTCVWTSIVPLVATCSVHHMFDFQAHCAPFLCPSLHPFQGCRWSFFLCVWHWSHKSWVSFASRFELLHCVAVFFDLICAILCWFNVMWCLVTVGATWWREIPVQSLSYHTRGLSQNFTLAHDCEACKPFRPSALLTCDAASSLCRAELKNLGWGCPELLLNALYWEPTLLPWRSSSNSEFFWCNRWAACVTSCSCPALVLDASELRPAPSWKRISYSGRQSQKG